MRKLVINLGIRTEIPRLKPVPSEPNLASFLNFPFSARLILFSALCLTLIYKTNISAADYIILFLKSRNNENKE